MLENHSIILYIYIYIYIYIQECAVSLANQPRTVVDVFRPLSTHHRY